MSDLQVSLMKEEDIDGAIATVQRAFAEDPYNKWIYNVRENVRASRYSVLHLILLSKSRKIRPLSSSTALTTITVLTNSQPPLLNPSLPLGNSARSFLCLPLQI